MKGKSVPRAKMEDGFEEILKGLQPAQGLFELAKAMLRDAWDMRLATARGDKDEFRKQYQDVTSRSKVCWIGSSEQRLRPL